MSDEQLLRECRVEAFRGSGPGGQKKNKTSSAIRITHVASGVNAIAAETRSQHDNRKRALTRLRLELAMKQRRPWAGLPAWWSEVTDHSGRLAIGARNPRYPEAMAVLLDALEESRGSVADAAKLLGSSTAGLVADLAADPHVWPHVQAMRTAHGQRLLANPRK